jgi:hypothetical protein
LVPSAKGGSPNNDDGCIKVVIVAMEVFARNN